MFHLIWAIIFIIILTLFSVTGKPKKAGATRSGVWDGLDPPYV